LQRSTHPAGEWIRRQFGGQNRNRSGCLTDFLTGVGADLGASDL